MIRQKKIKTSEILAVLHNRNNTSALAVRTLGQGNQNIKGGRLSPNWEASCGFEFSLSLIQGKKISLIMVIKAFCLLYQDLSYQFLPCLLQWHLTVELSVLISTVSLPPSNVRHAKLASISHLLVPTCVNMLILLERHTRVISLWCSYSLLAREWCDAVFNSILRICFLHSVSTRIILVWVPPEADPVTNIQMQIV